MLTPKQENFCIEYMATGNATEAYRRAYPTSLKWKEGSVNRKAKEMLDDAKIMSRLAELKQPAIDKACLTFDAHLSELQRLKEQALLDGNIAAAIKAEELRGKAAGLYSGKGENNVTISTIPIVQVQV